jgi:hypothetical protein
MSRVYIRKDNRNIFERFHNYGVKFVAHIKWDYLFQYPEIHLRNNVSYKRLDFPTAIVKVFKKSILVTLRASEEVKGLNVKDAEKVSKIKLNEVLDLLPKCITLADPELVNVHNAFVNHPTAKHNVRVVVDDHVRLISDHSKGHLEFEAVNPDHAISDSEILEKFNEDLIVNNPDPLSVQQNKIDYVVNVLDRYATQMELHLTVEQKTSDVLDRISQSIDQIVSLKVVGDRNVKGSMKSRRSFGVTSPRCHR